MNTLKRLAIAGVCFGALLVPTLSSASLIDEDITVQFDWPSGPDTDTQDTTAGGPGGIGHVWSDGDTTQLDDYFFNGDSLEIGTDLTGDFLRLQVGTSLGWGPMTLTISGWEEDLLSVNSLNGGVSNEALSTSSWAAQLNFAAGTDNYLYFTFRDVVEPPQNPPAVPLPAGAVLLLTGLGVLGIKRRRKS